MKGVCSETRARINVALYAYAYEIKDDPLVSDAEFDELCAVSYTHLTLPTKA